MPFGMVYALSQAFFSCIVFVLLAGYCLLRLKQGRDLEVRLRMIWPETLGFVLVLGWGIFQISTLTPESWHHPL